MKRWFVGGFLMAGVVLALPVSNFFEQTKSVPPEPMPLLRTEPTFKPVAAILQKKCLDCHSVQTHFPVYANFPIAKDLIQADIRDANRLLDMGTELFASNAPVSEPTLGRLEGVLNTDSMPPMKYKAMHWDAGLTDADKKVIRIWMQAERRRLHADAGLSDALLGEPVAPLPETVSEDPQKVALGSRLFHDPRLSGDNTISCASCHDLNKGGTDQAKVSTGIHGQLGPINAPTVYNARYNFVQFWDGRAKDLTEQAGGPVANPGEMGSNWPQVFAKLRKDVSYVTAFNALYPDGMTGSNAQDAIAAFENTLVTPNAPFDQYLRGKENAISAEAKAGYKLFKAYGCATCHVGAALGGQSFEKMGVKGNYFGDRGHLAEADNGRFNVTKQPADRHMFKVPTLRNIAVTYPYFHDGSTSDLKSAVKTMARYQSGKHITEQEAGLIVQFLNTLTGEYQGRPLQ